MTATRKMIISAAKYWLLLWMMMLISPTTSRWLKYYSANFLKLPKNLHMSSKLGGTVMQSGSTHLPPVLGLVRGGSDGDIVSALEDPNDITLLEKINSQDRIDRLLNLAGRIPAIRDSVDVYLHISKAAKEDALLATAVLVRVSSLIGSNEIGEKVRRDRRLEQLLEVIEVQTEPLHSSTICELIQALSKLNIASRDLLLALEQRSLTILNSHEQLHTGNTNVSTQRNVNSTTIDSISDGTIECESTTSMVIDASWLLQGFGDALVHNSFQTINVSSNCFHILAKTSKETLAKSLSPSMLINSAWALSVMKIDDSGALLKKDEVVKQLLEVALSSRSSNKFEEDTSFVSLNRLLSMLHHYIDEKHMKSLMVQQLIRLRKLFYLKDFHLKEFPDKAGSQQDEEKRRMKLAEEGKQVKTWYEASREEQRFLVLLLWRLAKTDMSPPQGLVELVLDRVLHPIFPLKSKNRNSLEGEEKVTPSSNSLHENESDELKKFTENNLDKVPERDSSTTAPLSASQLAKLGWALTTFAKKVNSPNKSPINEPSTTDTDTLLAPLFTSEELMFDLKCVSRARSLGEDATRVVVLAMSSLGPSGHSGVGVSCEANDLVDLLWALQERSSSVLFEGMSGGLGLEWAATLGRLTVALEASLGALTTEQVVSVIHSYAALKLRPVNLLNLAARRLLLSTHHRSTTPIDLQGRMTETTTSPLVHDFIDDMTPKEVAIVAVAFASMGHPAPSLYTRLAAHMKESLAAKFEPKDLSKVTWALARAGHELGPLSVQPTDDASPTATSSSCSSILLPKISEASLVELGPTDLSRLHWALSSMLLIPPPPTTILPPPTNADTQYQIMDRTPYEDLFCIIHKAIELKLLSFSPAELVDTAWGLAKLRRRQPKLLILGGDALLDRIARACTSPSRVVSPSESNSAWDLSVFTAHQLARLSWAFANWSGSGQTPLPSSSRQVQHVVHRGISMCEVRTEAVLSIGREAAKRLATAGSGLRADVYYCGAAQQWHEVYMSAWQSRLEEQI